MTNYAEQHNLKTKGAILQRIEELKRNTFPNKQLIEELENMTFLDEVVGTTNSTRHKSRNGESHKDRVFTEDSVLGSLNLFGGEKTPPPDPIRNEIQIVGLLKNFYSQLYQFEDITVMQSILQAETVEEINNIMDKIRSETITDDSIKATTDRREEAYKENNGKTDYSEIDFDIIDLMARRFNANKHKYLKGNMLKPIDENQLLMALYRHWRKMFQPIPNDEETFEEHLAAILCNAQMIYQQRKIKNEQRKIT
jgi:hypothetical protein